MSSKAQRSAITLGLFLVVGGGLGLWAYLNAQREVAGDTPGEVSPLAFAPEQVARLRVEANRETTEAFRTPYGWRLSAPHEARADPAEVARVLKNLSTLRAQVLFTDDKPAPADDLTGLDEPRMVFTLQDTNQTALGVLQVGKPSDFDHSIYVRATDHKGVVRTLTVGAGRESQLTSVNWEALRDKRIPAARQERITDLMVAPGQVGPDRIAFHLEIEPNSKKSAQEARYRITEPPLGAASRSAVRDVFKSLLRAPLVRIADHNGASRRAEFGLDQPMYTVTYHVAPLDPASTAPAEERTLWFADKPNSEYLYVARADEPWVAETLKVSVEGLAQTESTLRSARLTGLDRDDVVRIEINTQESGHIILEKRPDADKREKWQMLAPEPAHVHQHLAVGLLLAFADVVGDRREAEGDKVKDPAVLARTGLSDPMTVQLVNRAQEVTTVLVGYGKKEGEAFAMLEDGDMIVAIGRSRIDELPLSATQLIDPS